MEVPGQGFTCGLGAANRYLDNMNLEPKPTEITNIKGWAYAQDVTDALNEKVNDVALPIIFREVAIPTDQFTPGNQKEDIQRAVGMLTKTFTEEDNEYLENITQFIMLRGGHYTVFEKNQEGQWQEWDKQKGITKLPKDLESIDAIMHAFKQIQYGDSSAIIFQGKPQQ